MNYFLNSAQLLKHIKPYVYIDCLSLLTRIGCGWLALLFMNDFESQNLPS